MSLYYNSVSRNIQEGEEEEGGGGDRKREIENKTQIIAFIICMIQ